MLKQLPKHPSLEHLKNEAKALLQRAKKGDSDSLKQIGEPRLSNAQLTVARQYGFPSWSKLKRAVVGYADQCQEFFAAIGAGDRERAELLLSDNPSLIGSYDSNSFGSTPIGAAARRDDRPMIELLLRHGADINARSDWWAGSFGVLDFSDGELTKFLLSKGATLTPHAAARLGMAKELRKMISRNPEVVQQRGGDGQYPLHFAKTPEIVDILLDAGADIDARDLDHEGTPAQTRILDEPVLRRLVERGAKTDVFSAIAVNDLELVIRHVDDDPEALERRIDQPGNPMIPQAPGRHAYCYNLHMVRPLQAALLLGRERIYEELYQRSSPKLRLVSSCWKGDREAAKQVLEEHPDLMSKMTRSESVQLCEAAWHPRPETVALMLEMGFDVNTTQDDEKMTAIHCASFHGRDDLIEIILPYKPDLEMKNVYGGTVLGTGIYGSLHGWHRDGNYAQSTELLIRAGAKLPEKVSGSREVIKVLRRHGVP